MGIADDYTRFTLRIPELLHKGLLQRARRNQRSLNSEIIAILEREEGIGVADQQQTNGNLEEQFGRLNSEQQEAVRVMMSALLKS